MPEIVHLAVAGKYIHFLVLAPSSALKLSCAVMHSSFITPLCTPLSCAIMCSSFIATFCAPLSCAGMCSSFIATLCALLSHRQALSFPILNFITPSCAPSHLFITPPLCAFQFQFILTPRIHWAIPCLLLTSPSPFGCINLRCMSAAQHIFKDILMPSVLWRQICPPSIVDT